MSAQKGYPSKERDLRLGESDVYVTAEPIRQKQHGTSVLAHQFVRSVGTDAVEANSTTKIINATAHAAKVGDILNFTSGNLSGQEVKVQIVTANTITTSELLPQAPAAADTFQILRHKYPLVGSDGNLNITSSAAPVQFVRDGVDTEVSEDTGTPGNSRPLPVKLVGASGDINITAGDLNVNTQFANDSMDVSGSLVDIDSLPGTVESDITAIKTSVEILDNAISGSEMQVDIVAALPAGNNNIGDVDVASLPGTVATDITAIKTAVEILDNTVSGNELQVDIVSSALPSGASTEATLSTLNGKVPSNLTVTSTRLLVSDNRPAASTFIRNDYTSTGVTTGAYVELVASTANAYRKLQIFDSSGQTLKIATGAAASEADLLLVFPGGNGDIDISIPAGTRISIRAVSANAAVGEICINFLA